MKVGVFRLWLDELERLPAYNKSIPTGVCAGKTWKRKVLDQWWIGQYNLSNGVMYTCWYRVRLLQGPRRGDESLRFKVQCTDKELWNQNRFGSRLRET